MRCEEATLGNSSAMRGTVSAVGLICIKLPPRHPDGRVQAARLRMRVGGKYRVCTMTSGRFVARCAGTSGRFLASRRRQMAIPVPCRRLRFHRSGRVTERESQDASPQQLRTVLRDLTAGEGNRDASNSSGHAGMVSPAVWCRAEQRRTLYLYRYASLSKSARSGC